VCEPGLEVADFTANAAGNHGRHRHEGKSGYTEKYEAIFLPFPPPLSQFFHIATAVPPKTIGLGSRERAAKNRETGRPAGNAGVAPPLMARKNSRQFREFSHLRSSFRDAHSPRGPTAPDTAGRPCLDVLADDGPPSLARQGARYRHYLFGSAGRLTSIRWLDARHVGRSSREASTERRAGRFVRWPMPPHKRRVAVPARDQPEKRVGAGSERSLGSCDGLVRVSRGCSPPVPSIGLRRTSIAVPRWFMCKQADCERLDIGAAATHATHALAALVMRECRTCHDPRNALWRAGFACGSGQGRTRAVAKSDATVEPPSHGCVGAGRRRAIHGLFIARDAAVSHS
jgi:hypothetical protein